MSVTLNVLLRDGNGSLIGRGLGITPQMLAAGPVYVSIPLWEGSTQFYVVELRHEPEPAVVQGDGAPLASDPEPGTALWAGTLAGDETDHDEPEPADVPERARRKLGLGEVADQFGAGGDPIIVVTIDVLSAAGRSSIDEIAGPERTIGAIADDLAERLELPKADGWSWTLAAGARDPFDRDRCLTPAADGMTFALVAVPAPAHTGQ